MSAALFGYAAHAVWSLGGTTDARVWGTTLEGRRFLQIYVAHNLLNTGLEIGDPTKTMKAKFNMLLHHAFSILAFCLAAISRAFFCVAHAADNVRLWQGRWSGPLAGKWWWLEQ